MAVKSVDRSAGSAAPRVDLKVVQTGDWMAALMVDWKAAQMALCSKADLTAGRKAAPTGAQTADRMDDKMAVTLESMDLKSVGLMVDLMARTKAASTAVQSDDLTAVPWVLQMAQ